MFLLERYRRRPHAIVKIGFDAGPLKKRNMKEKLLSFIKATLMKQHAQTCLPRNVEKKKLHDNDDDDDDNKHTFTYTG